MTQWFKYIGIAGALLLAGTFILGGTTLTYASSRFPGGVPFLGQGGFGVLAADRHSDAGRRGNVDDFVGSSVFDARGGMGHRGGVGGEVTGIDGSTFTVDAIRGNAGTTVQTDSTTRYVARNGDELSLDDIKVGGIVFVKGRPADGAADTIQAEVIGIK